MPGLGTTDPARFELRWKSVRPESPGSFTALGAYRLVGNGSFGISTGPLVYFSEDRVNETTPATKTPWIAYVSCDSNATSASSADSDIFKLAQSKGAIGALLYSRTSTTCFVNAAYPNRPFDVFSAVGSTTPFIAEAQLRQLGREHNLTYYDPQKLDSLCKDVEASIKTGNPSSADFLLADLRAYNATTPGSKSLFNGTAEPLPTVTVSATPGTWLPTTTISGINNGTGNADSERTVANSNTAAKLDLGIVELSVTIVLSTLLSWFIL